MKPIKAAQRSKRSARTLQEKYESKLHNQQEAEQLREILEAAQYADMILEALDETELKRATFTLKKLKGIKAAAKNVPTLSAACSEAMADVNEFMGGGIMGLIKKGVSAIASKFGIKVGENPILGSLTLLNALEAGGEALPDLIQNNIENYDEKSDKSPLDQADEAGKKNMAKAFRKALVPEGVFSKIASLFKAGSIPYVDNIDAMVEEILKLKPAEISAFVNAIRIGPDTGEAEEAAIAIVGQSKSAKKGGSGAAAEEVPSKGEAVSGAKQLAVTIAAGNAAEKGETGEKADAAVEAAKEDPTGTTNKFIDFVAGKSKQEPAVVKTVVSAMLKSQMLSANFEIKESVGRRRHTAELTGFDVLRARQCLRECSGSTSRWVELLFLNESSLLNEDKVSQINSAVANNIEKIANIDQLVASVKDKFKDLSDEEKKKLLDNLGGNSNLTKKLKVKPEELKKSLSEKLSSAGGSEAKKAEPPAPEKALKLFKDQKIDLKDPKGRLDAVKTLKSQYGMDAKEASAFIKDKVQPLADQGAGGGEKKHPLDKVTDKIAAAKSFEDIANLFKKMKPEKVIIGQLNGKDVNLTDQIRNLEAMAKDPEAIKNINAFTRKGGLRNKVKEILAAGKKGEGGKGGSRSDKVVDQLKDQLKDVKPEQIKAVVDAIPEFLFKAA